MKKRILYKIIKFAIFPLGLIVLLDYMNVPSHLGIHTDSINYGLLGTIINSLVVIVVFIISFIAIDEKQISKDENVRDTANILLWYSYQKCNENLQIVDNQQMLEQFVIPKIDFDKPHADSRVITNLQNNPFEWDSNLLKLASDGAIDKQTLIMYLKIKGVYKNYISNRITFFDLDRVGYLPQHMELKEYIENDKKTLNSMLVMETQRLSKIIGVEETE